MARILLFLGLLVLFVVWNFPHELLIRRFVAGPLAEAGVAIDVESARFSLPLGIRAEGLSLAGADARVRMDSLYVSLLRNLDIEACGGEIRAGLRAGPSLHLEVDNIDPATCLEVGDLILGGRMGGKLEFQDLPMGGQGSGLPASGHVEVDIRDGTFGGLLPGSGGRPPTALGEWNFEQASIEADIENGALVLRKGQAQAQGVQIETLSGSLEPTRGNRYRIALDFRARASGGGARGKAILGMLPKATEDAEGWRRYRSRGTADNPELLGLK